MTKHTVYKDCGRELNGTLKITHSNANNFSLNHNQINQSLLHEINLGKRLMTVIIIFYLF